jgi:hypothetical protein
MPTTDPLRRDVQLDLFFSNIIGSIEIQKSYTADMPGDTTGGSIGMNTKDVPDEYINELSGSLAYIVDVTGEDIITYEGSDTDSNRALRVALDVAQFPRVTPTIEPS